MLFVKLSVDGLGYLVLFLFGAGLLFWGLQQIIDQTDSDKEPDSNEQ